MKVAVVVQEAVAFTVARIAERRGVVFSRVQITAYIEIKLAVVVVISRSGDHNEGAAQITGFGRHIGERAITVISKEAILAGATTQKKILITVVIKIGKDAHVHARQIGRQTCLRGYVTEGAIVIVVVQTRIITIAKEDVVPAVIVIIYRRNSSWPIFDHFVFCGLPFGRRPHGVMVRDEIDSGALCYISEALPVAGYGFAVNQFLFRHLP